MELWVTELTQRPPRVWQDNPVIHSGRSTPFLMWAAVTPRLFCGADPGRTAAGSDDPT